MDYLIATGQYTVIATAGIILLFKTYIRAEKWISSRQASKPARSK